MVKKLHFGYYAVEAETAQEGVGIHAFLACQLQRFHFKPAVGTRHPQPSAVGLQRSGHNAACRFGFAGFKNFHCIGLAILVHPLGPGGRIR